MASHEDFGHFAKRTTTSPFCKPRGFGGQVLLVTSEVILLSRSGFSKAFLHHDGNPFGSILRSGITKSVIADSLLLRDPH